MYNSWNEIKKVHLEITQNCQAACPMCDRNMRGKGVNPHLNLDELTLDDCKRMFEPEFISNLEAMYMCGNHGDPIVARDTLEVFQYFRKHNPTIWLSLNTNAGARDEQWWKDLAECFGNKGVVYFSVDGLSDTNHIYRQNVIWDNVERSMKSFINAGGRARWDFLIFQHNEHQVDEAEALSKEWGFEQFRKKKSGRFITTKQEKKTEHQAISKKGEKSAVIAMPTKKKNQNAVVNKADEIAKKHGSMEQYYDNTEISCKSLNEKEIYVSAEGIVTPCCWTAGRMYKWWKQDPKTEQIWNYIDGAGGKDAVNIKLNGIEKVIETGFLDDIKASWSKPSCAAGKLEVCAQKCGKEWKPFEAQLQ